MSHAKTIDGMRYEATGKKRVTDTKAVAIEMVNQLSTSRLLWLLVKRHKVAILATGNVILVLNWMIPAWTQIVLSLFN